MPQFGRTAFQDDHPPEACMLTEYQREHTIIPYQQTELPQSRVDQPDGKITKYWRPREQIVHERA